MKLIVWEEVGPISTRWHDTGGVVAIAESRERAEENELKASLDEHEPEIVESGAGTEHLWIFENAGCC